MQVCTSLQSDNHASTPPLSFLQAGCPSCRPANSVKGLKAMGTEGNPWETTAKFIQNWSKEVCIQLPCTPTMWHCTHSPAARRYQSISPARRAHSSKSAALSMAAVGTCWDKWTEGWRERWMDRQKDTMRTVPRATAIIIAWCHSTGSQRPHRYCSSGQEVSMGCCSSDGRMRGVPHCQCM